MPRYALNPLHIVHKNTYRFQITPSIVITGRPKVAIDAIVKIAKKREGLPLKDLASMMCKELSGSTLEESTSFVKQLINAKIFIPESQTRPFVTKLLNDYLKIVCKLHCRTRKGLAVKPAEWPITIFASRAFPQDEFPTHLLLVATKKNLPFTIHADTKRSVMIEIQKNGLTRQFSSSYRDVPEFDIKAHRVTEDKWATNYFCTLANIPVPAHIKCKDLADGKRFASRVGFPLVVKPTFGHDGLDVFPHVKSHDDLEIMLRRLLPKWKNKGGISIEKFVPGNRYRVILLGSKLVGVAAVYAPKVTGDGKKTITELIERENKTRLKTQAKDYPDNVIPLSRALKCWVQSQGYKMTSVLSKGVCISVCGTINTAQGGSVKTISPSKVHPEVIEITRKALRLMGLHYGGVDYIAPNISEAPDKVGGKITEMQAHPGGTHCINGKWRTFILQAYLEFVEQACDYAFNHDMTKPPALLKSTDYPFSKKR